MAKIYIYLFSRGIWGRNGIFKKARKYFNICKKYQKGNNYQMIKGVAQTARLSIRNGNSFTLNTKTQWRKP